MFFVYKIPLPFGRLEEKKCTRKQEEEKALICLLDGYPFSSLTLNVV